MWEDHKVYKPLNKKDYNPVFKQFGATLISYLNGYSMTRTNSMIKLSKQVNQLELAVFIEKRTGGYWLEVKTAIKPVDFYRQHKFTMLNIVELGTIMKNSRRTSYPMTQEWKDLVVYIAARINIDIELYFELYNSYEKIVERRTNIEPGNNNFPTNRYELLIYAAIRTRNKELLNQYLVRKLNFPMFTISSTEYLKPDKHEVDELALLRRIQLFAQIGDFDNIEREISKVFR
jgi:hypothetical protein